MMSFIDSVNRTHSRPTLPKAPTRILGREPDVERLVHLLSTSGARLITLTGPGGVGKTRLAIEVAHRMSGDVAGEAYWVDLATVREAGAAITVIAESIGIQERHNQSLLSTIVDALRERRALLALDNIEQVAGIADPVAELIVACPEIRILCTGRSPLDLRAEQRYPVEPLIVPKPDALADYQHVASLPVVTLYVERAQAVRPDFALTNENAAIVARICQRLDGLPLAIELASAQTELFSPADLLTRLERQLPLIIDGARDLPARHRTMEQTIAWSYDLLGDDLQVIFRSLSVFVGGFTLPAAGALLHDSVDAEADVETMRRVSALLRRSLLHRGTDRAGQERFQMLEMTRAYALDRLRDAGEAGAVRSRHARYALKLAEQANSSLSHPEGAAWLARLEADHDNLRAALSWALEAGETALAATLSGSLARFWYVRGHLSEGRAALERVLAALGDARSVERVGLLRAQATMAGVQGDGEYETTLARDALRLARELGDEQCIAQALQSCGNAARGQGDLAGAHRYSTMALTILERLGDQASIAAMLNNLGLIVGDQGDSDQARALFERSLAICERLGSERGLAIASCNLGNQIAESDGPLAAVPYYQRAITHFQAIEDAAGVAWSVQAVAALANSVGEPLLAARLYGTAEAVRERIGWTFSDQERVEYDESLRILRQQIDEHEHREAWGAGRELTIEAAIAEALTILERLASHPSCSAGQSRDLPAGLSEREAEILQLIATGLTNAEIAHRLRRSPHTIDAHVRRIYRKLDVQSRSAATRVAAKHGLL